MGLNWLVEESPNLDDRTLAEIDSHANDLIPQGAGQPRLAVLLQDVIVKKVRKLFGGAEIRIDALVVCGQRRRTQPPYMPQTIRFRNVHNGDRLPIDRNGVLIFNGKPTDFLDVTILASRDTKDSEDLAKLISQQATTPETRAAVAALTVGNPTAGAVASALTASASLSNMAYQALRLVAGNTIGMYRGSFLQYRDRFGVGPHPEDGDMFRKGELEFRYEIVLDKP